ncbi:adenylate/guanylate cyclase domain-containing protein [Thermodesulfobacteriota bacterium]
MTTEDFKRKLTAILSADVEGYSRLMGEDEDSTVRTLTSYRKLMSSLIERYHGRVVDSPGDNLLAEFESVRDAVLCAVEIQEELKVRNADLPDSRKMQFRIGINLGDIIKEEGRIYGDGVNVAARIESLADAGGICLSRSAYDQVKTKIKIDYEYLGEYEVKNIKEPVRVYRIRIEPETTTPIVKEDKGSSKTWRKAFLAVVAILILGAVGIWYFSFRQAPVVSDVKEAPKTIAVLPFLNLSSDPEQEYFSDGLADELINKLAQVKDLQVTARTSSFYFKDKNIDMRTIGETLGVTYLLEGRVSKSENQLRVTAQLIKAADGYHLWSKTYDRELKDVFAIEDDIAKAVTTALSITLGVGDFNIPGMTRNIEAYDESLRALAIIAKFTPDSMLPAIDHAKRTVEIDPDFGLGWVYLATYYLMSIPFLPPEQTVDFEARAEEALKRARAIAPDMPFLLMTKAELLGRSGNWLGADRIWKQMLDEQGHASSVANRTYGTMLLRAGRSSDALPYFQRAQRLDPLDPGNSFWLGFSLMSLGRLDETRTEVEHGKKLGSDSIWNFLELLIAFEAGDIKGAIALLEDFYSIENNDTGELFSEAFTLQLVELLKDENTDFALNKLRQMAADKSRSPLEKRLLSIWAAILGDPQLSFDILKEITDGMPLWNINLSSDVRQLSDFKKWLQENGYVDYWRGTGIWPDLCHPVGDDDFVCD